MQTIITVDPEKCQRDALCVADCPAGLLVQNDAGYPEPIENATELCIDCGHCVAVCPTGALDQRKITVAECTGLDPDLSISPGAAKQYLGSRRSIRQYRKRTVSRETILQLLTVASQAPSGHNTQPVRWLVFTEPEQVRGLAAEVERWMHWMLANQSEIAASLHLERVVAAWEKGQDRILRGAPHLIVGYAAKEDRTAPAAITNAIAYLELAACAHGLGTCWAGYFTAAAQTYPPLGSALGLPEDQMVFGAAMLGYPKARYHRIPQRKTPDVTWR